MNEDKALVDTNPMFLFSDVKLTRVENTKSPEVGDLCFGIIGRGVSVHVLQEFPELIGT